MAIFELNQKWNKFQDEDKYQQTLETLQQITVITNIANKYVYRKDCTGDYTNTTPNMWVFTKNGIPQYETDILGDIIQPPTLVYKEIITLDTILAEFYESIDPLTTLPYEVPQSVKIN